MVTKARIVTPNTTKLRVLGQNIHFDLGEMEIMKHLMMNDVCTEAEAIEQVIDYKREQVMVYERCGNYDLAEHLLKSIDEWDDTRAEEYKIARELLKDTNQKLIVPQ